MTSSVIPYINSIECVLKIDEETYLNIWLSRFYEGLEGSVKTDKAEELFKLIYLRFAPLKTDEVIFQNYISFLEEQKRNENLFDRLPFTDYSIINI